MLPCVIAGDAPYDDDDDVDEDGGDGDDDDDDADRNTPRKCVSQDLTGVPPASVLAVPDQLS